MGPNYGMWADTVEAMNAQARQLERSHASAEQWKKHCDNLEAALDEISGRLKTVSGMYVNKAAAEAAQARLKEHALDELRRLDPSNKMLDPEYRKSIYEREKDKIEKELEKK